MQKILFFLIIIGCSNLYAQRNDCGTKAKTPIFISEKEKERMRSIAAINVPYTVKIHVTVFADDDGSNRAANDTDILRQVQNMVNQYQPHNICFLLFGISQVNNTDLNTQVDSTEEGELAPFMKSGLFNIFVHKELPGLNGTAYRIPNTYLSIIGSAIASTSNLTTLAHEMGHGFGLYHTFETWGNTKQENVDRNGECKNCETNGDVLCDTPADDNSGVSSSCNYIGGGMDNCGIVYTPMTNNIMTYGNRACRNIFTTQQRERMQYFLLNDPSLKNFVVQDVVYLPGSSNASIYYNLGNQTFTARDAIWLSSFTNNVYDISGSATQTIIAGKVYLKPGTRLHPGSGRIQIKANPYCQ